MSNGFTSFFSKIFAGLLALILSIFTPAQPITSPGISATSQRNYFFNTLGGEQGVAAIVIDAVKNEDVDAIYNLYSKSKQEKIPDLKERINKLFSYIDGNVIADEFHSGGGESTEANFGVISKQYVTIGRKFYTDTGKKYIISIAYTIVDTDEPNNVGATNIRLGIYDSPDNYYAIYDVRDGAM